MNIDIYLAIIIAASIFFFFSLAANKVELIINFVLRLLVGILAIYLINQALLYADITSGVAINPFTMGVSGVLGAQGLALLYALGLYFQLR